MPFDPIALPRTTARNAFWCSEIGPSAARDNLDLKVSGEQLDDMFDVHIVGSKLDAAHRNGEHDGKCNGEDRKNGTAFVPPDVSPAENEKEFHRPRPFSNS